MSEKLSEEAVIRHVRIAVSEAEKKIRRWLRRNRININFKVYIRGISVSSGEVQITIDVEAPAGWKEIIENRIAKEVGDYLRNFVP